MRLSALAFVGLVACGGSTPTPSADLMGDTTVGRNRCQASGDHDRPFIIEWDATDIASFESKASRDVVFVKIDGCSLKVLDCRDDGIAAKYGAYDAPRWTSGVVEGFEIKNEGDLYAKLPFGATSLAGSIKGGNELQLKYFVSGSRPALRSLIYRNDIAANPLCASATHFVAGYDLGAFDLSTKGSSAGSAEVKSGLAGGGGNYSHSEGHLRTAGSLADCAKDTARELSRCRVPIRLNLRAIADGSNPAPPPTAASNGALPAGITEDFLQLIQSSNRKMQLKDGAGCLADLDRAEAIRNDKMHNLDMTRAYCEMEVGRCEDGKRRYRAFLERTAPQLSPSQVDESVTGLASGYCQGKEKTPAERVRAANADAIDANHAKDVTRCTADAKELIDACAKLPAADSAKDCRALQYVAECLAKNGGDCALGKQANDAYVKYTYADNTDESRAAIAANYNCPYTTAKPPPNKKKASKKKPSGAFVDP